VEWGWDELKYAAGIYDTVQIRPDWLLKCHPAAYRCAYVAQVQDPDQVKEFDCFLRRLKEDTVLFDIGAHFGLFSFAALHYGGPAARAVAIDPSPMAEKFMRTQARLNGLAERLEILKACVSDESGMQDMVSVGVLANGYYVAPSDDHSNNERTKIPSLTVDQLVKQFAVTPTHVKIDVEGYEAAVLRGGAALFRSEAAPIVFIELHNEIVREAKGDPEEALDLLHAYGYVLFDTDELPLDDTSILANPLVRIVAKRPHLGAQALPHRRSS
jgi:FkbM family methyltransferase